MSNMEFRLVRSELFHAEGQTDGQTDTTKLIVAFQSFSDTLKHDNMKALIVLIKRQNFTKSNQTNFTLRNSIPQIFLLI